MGAQHSMTRDLECPVARHAPLNADYWELELEAPQIAAVARPGQFVHVRVPGLESTALRRPFSIFNACDGNLKILYKTVGRGTARMTRLAPGDTLRVIGPLGNGFPLAPQGLPLLVAGGYGVAPLYFLATRLPRKGMVFIGARGAADILAVEAFEQLGWQVRVATQDGTLGARGLVTAPLDEELERLSRAGDSFTLYSCGPDGLLRALCERANAYNAQAWLSMDKRMVCGVGATANRVRVARFTLASVACADSATATSSW